MLLKKQNFCKFFLSRMVALGVQGTYIPTFAGSALQSALETADFNPESADSTTDFMTVCRLPVLNMFNISTLIQSANSSRLTISVGRLQNGQTTDFSIYSRPILAVESADSVPIHAPIQIKHVHSSLPHQQVIKNTIGVIMNHLVASPIPTSTIFIRPILLLMNRP